MLSVHSGCCLLTWKPLTSRCSVSHTAAPDCFNSEHRLQQVGVLWATWQPGPLTNNSTCISPPADCNTLTESMQVQLRAFQSTSTCLKSGMWCTLCRQHMFVFFGCSLLTKHMCLAGVLKYKRQSEQLLQQSGLPWTICRPGRLTDGPYTSYDLNTLLQATSGNKQDVQLSAKDDLNGQASRIVLAGLTSSSFAANCSSAGLSLA